MKLHIELQTPTIELPVKAKDASKKSASCIAGFKRHKSKESQELLARYMDTINSNPNNLEPLLDIIKDELVYFKKVPLLLEDNNGKVNKLVIEDTRKESNRADLWEDKEECFSIIRDLLLSSSCWQLPLITAAQHAASNIDSEELQVKN